MRHADEYNTIFAAPEECRRAARRVDEAARAAGREPLTFSLMTGCVVGRDEAEVATASARVRELTGARAGSPHGDRDASSRRSSGCASTSAAGVERVMLQHLDHEDVEMVDVLGELARAVA